MITEDWYFWSHRVGLARNLVSQGYKVTVATRVRRLADELRREPFEVVNLPFERSLHHPLRDALMVCRLFALILRLGPDIIHFVSLKPMVLGALALAFLPAQRAIFAPTGMGYLFIDDAAGRRRLRQVVLRLLRLAGRRRRSWFLVQNNDDRDLLAQARVGRADHTAVIAGSGVDIDKFALSKSPQATPPMVLCPARLLRDKGIAEFVEAARLLQADGCPARFQLAGALDPDNPAAIRAEEIERWVAEGIVLWHGHCEDMPALYRQAALVCLPSYREGLPKALLEGAASGLPLVATDVVGCREICFHQKTGLLVAPRDAPALAKAIGSLLDDAQMRENYGRAARALIETKFADPVVFGHIAALYERVADTQA